MTTGRRSSALAGAANVGWLLVVVASIVVFGSGLVGAWSDATSLGFGEPETMFGDGYFSLRSGELTALQDLGLNESAYAGFVIIRQLFLFGASLAIATILWRRSRTWVASYITLFLVVGNIMVIGDGVESGVALIHVLTPVLVALGVVSLLGLLYVFPDGRHARLFAALLGGAAAFIVVGVWASGSEFFWENAIYPMLAIVAGGALLQAKRIRSLPGTAGSRFALLGTYVFAVPILLVAEFLQPDRSAAGLAELLWRLALESVVLSLPLAMGLIIVWQITRHGLWDMELAVNRTAVYAALSALLAMTYVLAVLVIQAVMRRVAGIGSGNTFGVVTATALVAVVVLPAQRRIQAGIDRVFFRRRYDVTRTLASFSERVQTRENLGEVAGDLVGIVEDTFQPVRVAFFLPRFEEGRP